MFEILSICKGGGYLYCRTSPMHPRANANGLYPLHRVNAENKIGRLLNEDEVVHHIDEDKSNNSSDNLEVMTQSQHAKIHSPIRQDVILKCDNCQKTFAVKPHLAKLRLRRNKSKKIFCSRSCGATV